MIEVIARPSNMDTTTLTITTTTSAIGIIILLLNNYFKSLSHSQK